METTTALQSNAAPAEESQRFQQLQAGLPHIRQAPSDSGSLELIVARPAVNERNVLSEGTLDLILGLHGDTWKTRGSSKTADGLANPDAQITLMSSRAIQLVAGNKDRWPEAGDQLFIDLDLSPKNLPAGTRLEVGSAVVEVTPPPHTGCHKFAARFGPDATRLVNSPEGRQLNLRGINAKVVKPGIIRVGDRVKKLAS
jgi:hypothetical protein